MDYLQLPISSSLNVVEIIDTLRLTGRLLSVWVVISTAEWIRNLSLFGSNQLLDWRVVSLRNAPITAPPLASLVSSELGIGFILGLRLCSGLLLIPRASMTLLLTALLILLITHWLIEERAWLGADGSDQMGQIVTFGCAIMAVGILIKDPWVSIAGSVLIAGQLILSYSIAGVSKVISQTWRRGDALPGVMSSYSYGHAVSSSVVSRHRILSLAICWFIIVGETSFPVSLLMPKWVLWSALAAFAFFHISGAVFMGLNTFVWSFIATYPSVLLLHRLIHKHAAV